jgi:hypothetical protein
MTVRKIFSASGICWTNMSCHMANPRALSVDPDLRSPANQINRAGRHLGHRPSHASVRSKAVAVRPDAAMRLEA